MPAYAIAQVRDVAIDDGIKEYLRRIDETLDMFGGRFIIHDSFPEVVEGEWPGSIVVLEFPDRDHLERWYKSEVYQDILALRTDNSDGDVILAKGVREGYRGAEKVDEMEAHV